VSYVLVASVVRTSQPEAFLKATIVLARMLKSCKEKFGVFLKIFFMGKQDIFGDGEPCKNFIYFFFTAD